MNEKEAGEYIQLRPGGGRVAMQQRYGFYPDHYRMEAYCEGYLEAIEKAKKLEAELNRLAGIVCEEEQESIFVVLHQWEKEK